MAKLSLDTITTGYAAVAALNSNFDAIETALENTVSRDGTTPNQMTADLDLNGFSILNQANPVEISGFNWRGSWTTATAYAVGDVIETGGSSYVSIVAHTSGTFATDLSAAKWQLVATASLPSQASNSYKTLITNGTSASWHRLSVTPEMWGAVGDGTTDDTTALSSFITYLNSNPGTVGTMPAKVYVITSALPNVTASGFTLKGSGAASSHDVGSLNMCTIIKYAGVAGATMWTVAPTEGASAQRLDSCTITGVTLDTQALAAKGIVFKSMQHSTIELSVFNATTTGIELNVSTTLGEATSSQFNKMRLYARQVDGSGASGVGIRAIGTSAGNWSFNELVADVVQKNTFGIVLENSDNNLWKLCRILDAGGGTATNSLECRGGATSLQRVRTETFELFSSTLPALIRGTSSYTVASKNIRFMSMDTENATPAPTLETGANAYWENNTQTWVAYTPTVGSTSGTITTASATGYYKRLNGLVYVQAIITVTTNGTGAGALTFTMPFNSHASLQAGVFNGKESAITGKGVVGLVSAGTASCGLGFYDSTYPAQNGSVIQVSGWYQPA